MPKEAGSRQLCPRQKAKQYFRQRVPHTSKLNNNTNNNSNNKYINKILFPRALTRQLVGRTLSLFTLRQEHLHFYNGVVLS